MSEQLDYVNSQIEKAREQKLERMLSGNIKSIEDLQFDRGYLKAMQDVDGFQRDYVNIKSPLKKEED